MSLFDKFSSGARSLFNDMEKTLSKVTSASAFNRVVQASYLIARADGTIETSEKATLQAVIAKKFPHFKGADIIKAISEAEDELSFTVEGGVQMLLANIAKSTPDEAPVIMIAVLAVANADGEFDDKEKAVARQIASRLNLNPADYGL